MTGLARKATLVALLLSCVATAAEGFVEMCNDTKAGTAAARGMFQFRIEGREEVFEAPMDACTPPISVQAGKLAVRAVPTAGTFLADVRTLPADRLKDVDNRLGTAVISVPAGDISTQTIVIFTRAAGSETSRSNKMQPSQKAQLSRRVTE
jgi:hypothetical protein